ncbi:type II secretion system protein GspM [Patulibacter sp.]|uniref:type II secretion system protein GspM n=1 Tax=Patulibacter sp. TaxID=1912859 RepID=UPI002722F3CD|nr:type II secretion system protein GspM [Patulibacter sp.]MDO9408242.1 type II secretion system protein GspM [Patulibacter sp.]
MTAQMQKVLLALGVVIVAALLWVVLVSPARDDRTAAQDAQAQAESQAAAVAGQLATAKEAAKRTPQNEETLERLAIAVPEKVEAPALIDGLDSTAKRYGVTFDVLKVTNGAATATPVAPATATTTGTTGTTSTTATTATTPATAGTPAGTAADGSAVPGTPGTAAAPAGSVPVQLNIEIAGRYTGVTKFLKSIQSEVRVREGGRVSAKGRLLRVDSVDLASGGTSGGRTLKGTLSVVAYLLPKDAAATAATATAAPAAGSQP